MSFSFVPRWAALLAGALARRFRARLSRRRSPRPRPAQPAARAGSPAAGRRRTDQGRLSPTQNDWTKVCGKDQAANKDICYTTRDFSAQEDKPPVLALAVYDVKGDDTRIVRLLMPVGLMLRPGFRFAVDKGPAYRRRLRNLLPERLFRRSQGQGDGHRRAEEGHRA